MYADIAFQQKIGDQETLCYKVPKTLETSIKEGQLVNLTLRRRTATGLIWRLHDEKPSFKTVDIKEITNETPLLTPDQIKLANWISEYYFAPLFKVLKLFVPAKIFKGKTMKPRIKEKPIPEKLNLKNLTIAQKNALDTIESAEHKSSSKTGAKVTPSNKFLIHGITGSGKTEIYLHLAKKHLDNNEQVLILVPEISLTPQTVEYFESRLQIQAAVIHSKLSEGEKYKTWLDIKTREKNLVIGSRSSIFSPFTNLSLIIMDEEHEFSYKQDQSPRYETHKVAEQILELQPKTKLILGSATPSIETAFTYQDRTLTLENRIGNAKLPQVKTVDMREEFKKRNKSIFSDALQSKMKKTLDEGKQIILFLNRRGS
ncbi:primosomal protein N', partial [Candidatus Peregrinibacteria bacterium]|nr:primosomal protein N' [Candidatus Peregrinibacteria bacterium]